MANPWHLYILKWLYFTLARALSFEWAQNSRLKVISPYDCRYCSTLLLFITRVIVIPLWFCLLSGVLRVLSLTLIFCGFSRTCMHAKLLSHVWLCAILSVHEILQASILEWVAISSSRGSWTGRRVLYHSPSLQCISV